MRREEMNRLFDDQFRSEAQSEGVKVEEFDGCGLLEQRFALGIGGYQAGRALSLILLDEVSADCAGLVQDETVIVLIGTRMSTNAIDM